MAGIELRHFRYFLAVAEEAHFGRAAERLGISQPPLSQQIQKLEDLVGYALFERRPRVRLTAAGEALLEGARRTVLQADAAVEAARRAAEGHRGTLVVAFPASALLTLVPEAVRLYRERFPEVDLDLRELSTAAQVRALAEGSIDVGFLREVAPEAEDLVCDLRICEPYAAVLPADHPLSGRKALKLEELAEQRFVLFPRHVAPGLYEQVHELCRAAGFAPRIVQEAQEWLTIVGLVEAGVGLSLVPASFKRLRWGGVRYVELEGAGTRTSISLCRNAGPPRPPAVHFVRIVEALARGGTTHTSDVSQA